MSRFHSLTVAEVRRETPEAVALTLAVPEALRKDFAFLPGQYVTLRATIDGEDLRRSYSICAAPSEGTLRVGVKKVAGGAFSGFLNDVLREGDAIEVMPPEGRFVLKAGAAGRHLLCVAAGSGITPILSIVAAALAADETTRVTLVYGNRTTRSVMFAEALEDLKNRHLGRLSLVHLLSREAQDVALLSGRVTAEKLKALAAGAIDVSDVDEAFLCGPEGMVAEARAALVDLGVPAERIKAELFTPAAPRARGKPIAVVAGAPLSRVAVTLDGKRHDFDWLDGDDNVVDAAARAGLELPYSCHGGMCCTCRCRVTAGEAAMATNYSLEDWELKAGFVLACQVRPVGQGLALDFDQM